MHDLARGLPKRDGDRASDPDAWSGPQDVSRIRRPADCSTCPVRGRFLPSGADVLRWPFILANLPAAGKLFAAGIDESLSLETLTDSCALFSRLLCC
jgi:hypothetical protein